MSSPPNERTLEGIITDTCGRIAVCPDMLNLLEPYRDHVEHLLNEFNESSQSWRDYCGCIYGEAIPNEILDKVDALVTAMLVEGVRRAYE